MTEFEVNEYITLKSEDGKTWIYIKGEKFINCLKLILNLPISKISSFNEIDSIDDAVEKLKYLDNSEKKVANIPTDTEFWAHCSNLQVWVECNYNTRLLHSSLAFPLLKRLVEVGDPIAKGRFKEEIVKRIESKNFTVIEYLINSNYLDFLNQEEKDLLYRKGIESGNLPLILFLLNQNDKKYINIDTLTTFLLDPSSRLRLNLKKKIEDDIFSKMVIFPLMKKLSSLNISPAKDLFIQEITNKMRNPSLSMISNIIGNNYLKDFKLQELKNLFLEKNPQLKRIIINTLKKNTKVNSRLLDFLEILIKCGDPIAKKIFTEQIRIKLENGSSKELKFLWESNYFDFFNDVEIKDLFKQIKIKSINLKQLKSGITKIIDLILIIKSIEKLDLSMNKIRELPKTISNLIYLKRINLEMNNLSTLPDTFKNLKSLQILNLRGNEFSQLPEAIWEIKSIEELYLERNYIKKIPETIKSLINLKILNLEMNKLEKIPEEIGELQSLEELNLENNKLLTLPNNLKMLKNLRILNLKKNKFKEFPIVICELSSLEELYIEDNELKTLPESIKNLKSLKIFGFEDFFTKKSLNSKTLSIIEDIRKNGVKYPIFLD